MTTYAAVRNFAKGFPAIRRWKYRAEWAAAAARQPRQHADWYFHKHWVRHWILDTPPVPCGSDESFELRMLTCKRDVLEALWTLKSFFNYSELRPRVVIHDDGSLGAEDRQLLVHHVPGLRIVARAEADAKVAPLLAGHPHCSRYRFDPAFVLSLKLFDTNLLSTAPNVLLLDSDVLFFRKPTALEQHVQSGTGCYQSDYQDSYVTTRAEMESRFALAVPAHLNCGIFFFPRRCFDLDLLEQYFEYAFSTGADASRLRGWGEQTAYALLVAKHVDRFVSLPRAYQLSSGSAQPDAVCGHFVNDDFRPLMYSHGMKRLRKDGLLG
jgi:hypothetical protein